MALCAPELNCPSCAEQRKHLEALDLGRKLADHSLWLRGAGGSRFVLRDAVLTGADLRGAVLTDAVLTGAVLRGAVLTGADLGDADLTDAVLRRADLGDAALRRADLGDAGSLAGARLPVRNRQIGPLGSRDDTLVWLPDMDLIKTGCFSGTMTEFEAAVEKIHGSNAHGDAYRAAIAYLRATMPPVPQDGALLAVGDAGVAFEPVAAE